MADIIYSILLLINIIATGALGFIIYVKKRNSVFNQTLSASMFFSFIWMSSHFARYSIIPFPLSVTKEQFFYWAKVSHYAGIFLAAYVGYFLISFPDRKNKPLPRWFTILWLAVIPFFCGALNFFNLVVKDMHLIGDKYFIIAGPLMPVYLLCCATVLFSGVTVIIKKLSLLTGLPKMQAKYVGGGFLVSSIFIIGNNLLLPSLTIVFPYLLKFSGIYRFAPFYTLIFFYCTAYTIMKHRLLDIELVISRSAGYLIATIAVIGGYIMIVALTEQFVRGFVGYSNFVISSMSALIVAFTFQPLRSFIQEFVYNKFFAGRFKYQQFLLQASQRIVTILNMEELINYFVDTVQHNIGTQRAAFLLRNEEEEPQGGHVYYIQACRGISPEIVNKFEIQNGLISWFNHTRQIFIKDEAELEMAEKGFSKLYGRLDRIGAKILVPVFSKESLAGILALDRKNNGRIYSQADIDILNILSAEVGIALENSRLYGEAITDSLTGLFNRRYFDHRLQEELLRARRYRHSISLLMIDVDKFKEINDGYGHPAGDFILKQLAHIIRKSLRQIDIVSRYGGEEIMVILIETGEKVNLEKDGENRTIDACRTVAERIRKNVAQTNFHFGKEQMRITVSVGMTCCNNMAEDEIITVDTLVDTADKALYRAKKDGRNCVRGLI